ncbi:hypothetical protein Purlil1_12914 [Purpureocillium lilacinum]|uniref:Uncharacterized protein n=1 Tax=Purpureocillium lilacinum TaxID=33203 RepID=A0ABR0BG50_PURLI|nr:hypothetical protein Purlil1_12914 [Purpureocillium lilacinum]
MKPNRVRQPHERRFVGRVQSRLEMVMCVLRRTRTGESEDVPPCVGRMCGPHVWAACGPQQPMGSTQGREWTADASRVNWFAQRGSTTRAAEQRTKAITRHESIGTPKDQLRITMEQRSEVCQASEPVDVGGQREDSVERIRRIHRIQVDRFERRAGYEVRDASNSTQGSDWVRHVGWAQHLAGLDRARLRATRDPVRGNEPTLQVMCASLDRVLEQARATAMSRQVGSHALYEVARKDVYVTPRRPFDNRVEPSTWTRYKEVWRQLLCILHRTQEGDPADRPPYQLTERQDASYREFVAVAKFAKDIAGGEDGHFSTDVADVQCLETVMTWLYDTMEQGEYGNIMISGLSVIGIGDDGGWRDVAEYTTTYSAVIKVARMLVVYHAYWEHKDVMALGHLVDDDTRAAAASIFRIVRRNVRQFTTKTPDIQWALRSPLDWIYESRTYGMRIRFEASAGGAIQWRGKRIRQRQIQFTMEELRQMLHALVDEARGLLAELTAVEQEGISRLPPIPWSKLEDDHSEDRAGYSFLHDARNTWLAKGEDWVLDRILSEGRRELWLTDTVSEGDDCPYKACAVDKYARALEQFRERLWMVMHMVAGQPARSAETLGIRYVNTVHGGVRNILAHNGMICLVMSDHENTRSTSEARPIHRYLPREVGELLVWYLWLALPFWQEVQGIVKQADIRSPFLWPDEVVSRTEEESEAERRERVEI